MAGEPLWIALPVSFATSATGTVLSTGLIAVVGWSSI
jgi:hypothetical protein